MAFQSTKPTVITPASSSQTRTPGNKKVMPANEPIKQTVITPARSSQARTPGKKKVIQTSEPVLPYFDISNDPYFIKA